MKFSDLSCHTLVHDQPAPGLRTRSRNNGQQKIRRVRAAGVERDLAAEDVGRPIVGVGVGHAAGATGAVVELLAEVRQLAFVTAQDILRHSE